MSDVPKSHPRYVSLKLRDEIVDGVKKGVTSIHGLLAHGRGEAFDYLVGEKTNDFALKAIEAAAAMLLLAKNPVISVNGNVAAIACQDIVNLSREIPAKIEVNIFHSSKKREEKIRKELLRKGAKEVLMPSEKIRISHIDHNRKYVSKDGIFKADVILVPLEDGDRCEALIKNGKKVITIDLNPMSRTAKTASITIVDNVIRALPALVDRIRALRLEDKKSLNKVIKNFDNISILKQAKLAIKQNI